MHSLEERLLADYDNRLNRFGVKGERVAARLSAISEIGITEEGGSCRIGFSDEERKAKELVMAWMKDAGLSVRMDQAGNVIGRLEGSQNSLPAVMSGSHIDTVPNGGHFDGVLGVMTALEVVEAWKETNYQPVRPFEIVIFSDEEGSRFNSGFTGSEAMMGDSSLDILRSLTDHNGQSFEEVISKNQLATERFTEARRDIKELAAFVEVHIEQGKRMEKAGVAVGIVSGIAGLCGLEVSFRGEAGHAGNTPMNDRKDALLAASQFVLKVGSLPETVSRTAVATVGQLHVYPNGSNVIPGEVKLSVDIRDIDKESRDRLVDLIIQEAITISSNHKVEVSWHEVFRADPVPLSHSMQQVQAESLRANQIGPIYLPSGAGHDAMVLGRHIPVAMFFVRSKDGISHNPKEWTSLDDCVMAVHALKDFLEKLSRI